MLSYIYFTPKRALFCNDLHLNQTFPVSSCYSVSGSELPIKFTSLAIVFSYLKAAESE